MDFEQDMEKVISDNPPKHVYFTVEGVFNSLHPYIKKHNVGNKGLTSKPMKTFNSALEIMEVLIESTKRQFSETVGELEAVDKYIKEAGSYTHTTFLVDSNGVTLSAISVILYDLRNEVFN